MAGSESKRSLPDWSQLGSRSLEPPRARSWGPIEWLKNGRMPSLWVMARLLLALGVVTAVGEVLAGIGLAFGAMGGFISHFWAVALPSMITFSVTTAVFLGLAALTAYLAARNDREMSQLHIPPEERRGDPPAP